MKLKNKKSSREKKRYILFKILWRDKFKREDIIKLIWNTALEFLGELGAAELSLWVMSVDEEKGMGIVRCNTKSIDKVICILSLVRHENKGILILGVSGTLKGLKKWSDIYVPERNGI
ncbi:MAG: ribonuclease P protein component 2 [Methanomicrobia archaeon]|nr:ribonuclease P protein component 2 [Methanomicrobia archaeon]